MKLYHQRLHEVKLVVSLSFRLRLDCGEDFRLVKVDFAGSAVLLVRRDAGKIPLLATDVSLMLRHSCFSSPSRFSDIRVTGVVFAVTREFVDDLFWREFDFVFSADDILELWAGRENDAESSFSEYATKLRGKAGNKW